MEKVKVAIISESAGNWPVYVGLTKGFFTSEGIEPEITITRSSVKQMEELSQGVYDIGHQAADHIIRAVEKGDSDLQMVIGLTTPNYSLITGPDIKTYEDLRGKEIGVDGVSTGFALLLQGLLEKKGLVRDVDYKFDSVGGTGERFNAVLEGKVAGAFLDGPKDLEAERKGCNRLGSNLDYLEEYQGTVAAVRREWADANEGKLCNYIRGYVKASDWLLNPANKEEAVQILNKYLSIDPEIAGKTYDRYMECKTFNERAALNKEGIVEVMKIMIATGQIKIDTFNVAKYLDGSYYFKALFSNSK